jgi:hypothetical protein
MSTQTMIAPATAVDKAAKKTLAIPHGLYFDKSGCPWMHVVDGSWIDRNGVRHGVEALSTLVLRIHSL